MEVFLLLVAAASAALISLIIISVGSGDPTLFIHGLRMARRKPILRGIRLYSGDNHSSQRTQA